MATLKWYNTVTAQWEAISIPTGALLTANALSELTSVSSTARTNIGAISEAEVIDTARQYTAGQGGTLVTLDIIAGETDIDFEDGNFFELLVDAATEIQAPFTDQPFSCVIFGTQDAATPSAVTFDAAYVVKGDAIPTAANDEFDINIQSDGAGRLTAIITDRQ